MKCVVLAGGGGLRLWPLSREKYPKQFLNLSGENTLFGDTIQRNLSLCSSFMILTNDEFRFIVEQQMNKLGIDNYEMLLEKIGRNTAPSITIACLRCNSDEILLVVPADLKIDGISDYSRSIKEAEILARNGYIVTFGIKPNSPHTGYGYINHSGNDVLAFKEKPNKETAVNYLESGDYLWNSGMFMFRADVFLHEISRYRNDILESCRKLEDVLSKEPVVILPREYMDDIPAESVDYAVMEHSDKIKVIPSDFIWNDVGSIESLCEVLTDTDNGNRLLGGNSIISNSKHVSIVNDTEDQLIVVNGIENTIVVNTNDAIYISAYGHSAEIKEIISKSSKVYKSYFETNIKNYRPWGFYEVLSYTQNHKVKRLTVYPHKRLSLQKHKYRSEHWTVVNGLATITIGTETTQFKPNSSAYIPIGELHRISNETDENIEIIEVSIGTIISEDDIVRIEDDFDRKSEI